KAGLSVGQPLPVSPHVPKNSAIATDMVLPIFAAQSYCHSSGTGSRTGSEVTCQKMVELRTYRPTLLIAAKVTRFELIDRLKVRGPEELQAIAPSPIPRLSTQAPIARCL
ncbi:MAG: hypothetical protein HC772_09905, partial [Leptolyngbyaceae cyanobacterium CRU_2_3]|nr:hypothetical protein [Leptolyngbyaceae cyanobacterium CRU_2_3]